MVFSVWSYLQENPRVFRMTTPPCLPAGDANNLKKKTKEGKRKQSGEEKKKEKRRGDTWFPSMRPPPESPLHGPMLGVTFYRTGMKLNFVG